MIYNGYNPLTDPFYEPDRDYTLSITNLTYVSSAEYLKQRILCSNCLSFFNHEALVKESVMLLLLSVPFLTFEHLVTLKLHSKPNVARVFVNRLAKTKQSPIRLNRANISTREKLFCLNNESYARLYNYLPEQYTKRRHILPSYKSPATGSFAHDTSAINLLCWLLSDRSFNFFEFWWRAPISITDKFDASIETYSTYSSLTSNKDCFIPDMVLRSMENKQITFIEQDMSTERLNQLESKFASYVSYLDRRTMDELNHHSILVSVDTKYTLDVNYQPGNNDISLIKANRMDFDSLYTIAATYHTASLDTLQELLSQLASSQEGNTKHAKRLYDFICKARSLSSSISTLDELDAFIRELEDKCIKDKEDVILSEKEHHFQKRLNTFRNLAERDEDLQSLFHHGLSIYVIDGHDFESLPYVLIEQYNVFPILMSLIMERHIRFKFNYTYMPYTMVDFADDTFVFKNAALHHGPTTDTIISIENVSFDISVPYRLRHFLTHAKVENSHVFYYLLVESENDAVSFYEKYLSDIKITDNIHIAFIQFKGVELDSKEEPQLLIYSIVKGTIQYY